MSEVKETPKLLAYRFATYKTPQCLWGWELKKENNLFLETFNSEYYLYLAEIYSEDLDGENALHAALAIRSLYSQALETLFAFIGAAVQAPAAVAGWLCRYKFVELVNLVRDIERGTNILTFLALEKISWQGVADIILTYLSLEDKEKEKRIREMYGSMWGKFSADFLDENASQEYNSIKHGLRSTSGGFFLRIGREDTPGVRASSDKMTTIVDSKFGSSFRVAHRLKSNRHFYLKRVMRNWDPEDMLFGIQLICLSIENIISFLKILNGGNAAAVKFTWPKDEDITSEPWKRKRLLGATETTMGAKIPENLIVDYSDQQILAHYQSISRD